MGYIGYDQLQENKFADLRKYVVKIIKDFLVLNNDDHNCDKSFKMAVLSPATILDIIWIEGGNM